MSADKAITILLLALRNLSNEELSESDPDSKLLKKIWCELGDAVEDVLVHGELSKNGRR